MSAGLNSRRPGRINLALTLLLLIIVVPLALHVATPPPPEIAEFNPSEQQIKEAPVSQSTQSGNAQGQGIGGPGGGVGLPSPSSVDLSRVRHCVRARQTEDPQSPPCVNYFGGANGGATYRGVTATTIRVAIPAGKEMDPAILDLEKYFNARFEFYGRKIQLVTYTPTPVAVNRGGQFTGGEDMPDATAQAQDARRIVGMNVFADLGYMDQAGDRRVFQETLARNGVMEIESDASILTEADYDHYAPYLWNYDPAAETNQENVAAWVCNRLKGYQAKYTQAPLQSLPRKFGLIVGSYPDGYTPDTSYLMNGLAACGISPSASGSNKLVVSDIVYDSGDQDFVNSVAKLDDPTGPVTTVLCYCQGGVTNDGILHRFQDNADNQNYYPEYIVNQFLGQDNDGFLLFEPPCDKAFQAFCSSNNRDHTFGIVSMTKWDQFFAATMPCGYSVREVDPGIGLPPYSCLDTETGSAVNGSGATYGYQSMLVLASGIQMAGPRLTPQTFQQGLFTAHFENPNCDGPPLYQGCVSFGPHDHTMQDSFVEVWASSHDHMDDTSGFNFQSTYCYGELTDPHGVRFRLPRPGDPVPAHNWISGRDTQYFFGEPCH